MKKVIIVGSGFSSLSVACYLGSLGYNVSVFEKNKDIGGRARQLEKDGFKFDMGPTFYWMPDIFEAFFADFNKQVSDYYTLNRLDPGYKVYFGKEDSIDMSADINKVYETFEKEEKNSSLFLRSFLNKASYNYRVAIDKVVYKPGKNMLELIMPETALRVFQFVDNLKANVRRHVKSEKLRQILEFPVLFLGAKPSKTPAFYCFMNYADIKLGTWHITGGMVELVKAMKDLAESYGVKIITNSPVEKIVIENNKAKGIIVGGKLYEADAIVSGADYAHTELLMDKEFRNYSSQYWQKKVFTPSALLFYVGFDKKIEQVSHHTLFFDSDFEVHARDIYDSAQWPDKPLFYASFPSITDKTMAPEGKEAGIFLIPIAPGIKDTEEIRQHYFEQIMDRLEYITNQSVRESVLFHESFSVKDFVKDYNAYKGNAYGLANVLTQTAFLKPKIQNKKVSNLFYTGQLTVPGPGVPPAIISGKIISEAVHTYLEN